VDEYLAEKRPEWAERSRVEVTRYLSDDHYGKIVRLLILTACRRVEIGDMCWREIDPERGTFTIPAERAKTGKARMIPLL
jgi:integrase